MHVQLTIILEADCGNVTDAPLAALSAQHFFVRMLRTRDEGFLDMLADKVERGYGSKLSIGFGKEANEKLKKEIKKSLRKGDVILKKEKKNVVKKKAKRSH